MKVLAIGNPRSIDRWIGKKVFSFFYTILYPRQLIATFWIVASWSAFRMNSNSRDLNAQISGERGNDRKFFTFLIRQRNKHAYRFAIRLITRSRFVRHENVLQTDTNRVVVYYYYYYFSFLILTYRFNWKCELPSFSRGANEYRFD